MPKLLYFYVKEHFNFNLQNSKLTEDKKRKTQKKFEMRTIPFMRDCYIQNDKTLLNLPNYMYVSSKDA
jgi:hypothetical protein